jgi:Lysylphosphatidylglycerol synthase TM region
MQSAWYGRWLVGIKVGISLLMIAVVYSRVSMIRSLDDTMVLFGRFFGRGHIVMLLAVLLLMPINWALEALKWQLLLRQSVRLSFASSLRSVLGGLSIGFATPGRIGEFAGRVLFLHEGERIDGIYLSAIGGLAQSLVTFGVAVVALWLSQLEMRGVLEESFLILALSVTILMAVSLFWFDRLVLGLRHLGWDLSRYVIDPLRVPSATAKAQVLLYSALRYGVYMLQYYLLVRVAGVESTGLLVTTAIAQVLMLQSISPLMPMTDMTVRGGIAVLVFGRLGYTMPDILIVPILLWLSNLLLPALIGYYYILKLKADDTQ